MGWLLSPPGECECVVSIAATSPMAGLFFPFYRCCPLSQWEAQPWSLRPPGTGTCQVHSTHTAAFRPNACALGHREQRPRPSRCRKTQGPEWSSSPLAGCLANVRHLSVHQLCLTSATLSKKDNMRLREGKQQTLL